MSYQRRGFNKDLLPKEAPQKGDRVEKRIKLKSKPKRRRHTKTKKVEFKKVVKTIQDKSPRDKTIEEAGIIVTYGDWIEYEFAKFRQISKMSDIEMVSKISKLKPQKVIIIMQNYDHLVKLFGDLQETFTRNFTRG